MTRARCGGFALWLTVLSACGAFCDRSPGANPQAAQATLAPRDSLAQIVVDRELAVELAAHEPNVIDPVAIRFDELGRMWVVEMRDYPTGPTPDAPARSRISILRDKDNDGFYETATVFADNLTFATGVQPWKGGVFVTLAGEVVYMKDTDGDEKVDVNETWYTGFAQDNQQLRANHPRLALDNHIYIAAGLRGGTITAPSQPNSKPVSIAGMDFRFDPLTRQFEATTGAGQFGLTFDDYGNRFVCSNRNPLVHVVLEDWMLKKNPLVAVSSVVNDVARPADESHVYPIGRAWTTSNLHAGQFTAACGVHIYRGDALPSDYYANGFTCEPTGHLVHREIMKPAGATFVSAPAGDGVEFFASRDEWSCPVDLETGPDGALYVVDMYRQIIEHPEWMPEELRHRPNLRAGNDRGRIFRVVPKNFRRPAPRQLEQATHEELVELLGHPNAWWRETASRVLLERQDKTNVDRLRQTARSNKSPPARIHALRLLDALLSADSDTLLALCEDSDARVVEQAIVVADSQRADSAKLLERVANLTSSNDARVRFRALLATASLPPAPQYAVDAWEEEAMLIAADGRGGTLLKLMLANATAVENNVADAKRFIARLARLASAAGDDEQRSMAIGALMDRQPYVMAGLTGILQEAARQDITPTLVGAKLDEATRGRFYAEIEHAASLATDTSQPEAARCDAIDLLAFVDGNDDVLYSLAVHDGNQAVRIRAIGALAKRDTLDPWRKIIATFAEQSPAMQRAILDGLLSQSDRTSLLLDSIVAGQLKPTILDALRAKQLSGHKDASIRERAEKLLAAAVPADREQVLAAYRPALNLEADPIHGRTIFEKRCAVCHRIANIGVAFAPDISDSRERTPLQLLTDTLQPNRAIDSNYFSYTAVTTDGRIHTGVLAAETSTSVTLKQQEGKSETLRRGEIESLQSDGVSYMPEGLERDIPPQDMADLISFIKNWRYLENPQELSPVARP